MNEPSGMGEQFAQDACRDQKWNKKDKKTRMQLTLFCVVIAIICIWSMGYYESFALLGFFYAIYLIFKLFKEVKSWFMKP